jgi:Fe-S-cluster-containing dehydrogenase component
MMVEYALMMKCDMCYDRTSAGKKPMCATVCPSGALYFGTRQDVDRLRPRGTPVNQFQFGRQTITTKVNMMVPRGPMHPGRVDVTEAMHEPGLTRRVSLDLLSTMHVSPEVA